MKTFFTEADVARAAGVKRQTIQVYRQREQFPKPDAETVTRRPLWSEKTVKAWLETR